MSNLYDNAKKDEVKALNVEVTEPMAKPRAGSQGNFLSRCKSLLAIIYIYSFTPILLIMAFYSWILHKFVGKSFRRIPKEKRLNVLVTGGKMSKASAVARAVGRDGHKVFTAEISPYMLCHTRFCSYVTKHYVLPRPTVQPDKWLAKMQQIVEVNDIDVIIPCTAPIESTCYAHLRKHLPNHVRVFAFSGAISDQLDNKFTFNEILANSGILCPETALMECTDDAVKFFKRKSAKLNSEDSQKRYIVKPAVYDPKARTEIMFLPITDEVEQLRYLKSRNASKEVPYVIQEVLQQPEYGSYAIYNKGQLTGFELFESAASCLVYRQFQGEQYKQVLKLHKELGQALNLTGQLTLDLMHTANGHLVPIECNPRIHSAICTLEGHRNLGKTFTDSDHRPQKDSDIATSKTDTFCFWFMDQLFLMARFWKPKNCFKLTLKQMLKGKDALLSGDDPLPFLAMYLLQIPSLLILELFHGNKWLKIDFCIGKIVKEGGD